MSYDIELKNKKTGEVAKMLHSQYVRGGTVSARMNPSTGILEQDRQIAAHINITYNYARYYYEATEGDERFAHNEVSCYYADGTTGPIKTEYGIRGIYGKTAAESIPMLTDMIKRIEKKYKNQYGEWITTERSRTRYFKDGKECKDPLSYILKEVKLDSIEEKYTISEGAMSCYWDATAANAIKALQTMIIMATDNMLNSDIVWDGD